MTMTTTGAIELVDLKGNVITDGENTTTTMTATESPETPPTFQESLEQFIREFPNKLFWVASAIVLLCALTVTQLAYQLLNARQDSKWEITIDDTRSVTVGERPSFLIFLVGFFIVCILSK